MAQDLTRADIRALKACLEIAAREPMRRHQLERMRIEDKRAWEQRARFACSCVQSEAMALRPWETAPCDAADDEPDETIARLDGQLRQWRKAHALVEQLRELGISPFVSDPVGEINRAREALRLQAHPALHVVDGGDGPPAA